MQNIRVQFRLSSARILLQTLSTVFLQVLQTVQTRCFRYCTLRSSVPPEIVGRTRLMNSFGSDINGEGIINIKAQVYQSLASNAIGIAKTVEGVDSGEVDDDGNASEYPAYTGAVEGVELSVFSS